MVFQIRDLNNLTIGNLQGMAGLDVKANLIIVNVCCNVYVFLICELWNLNLNMTIGNF